MKKWLNNIKKLAVNYSNVKTYSEKV